MFLLIFIAADANLNSLDNISCFQFTFHLLLVVVCLLGSHCGKVLAAVGKDDSAACVYKKAALFVHAIFAYLLERTTLCTYAGNKKEVAWYDAAYILE